MLKLKSIFCTFAIGFIFFFIDITLYQIIGLIGLQGYLVIIPILLYSIYNFLKKESKDKEDIIYYFSIEILNIFALIAFYCTISNKMLLCLVMEKYSYISFVFCMFLLLIFAIVKNTSKNDINENSKNTNNLFNLYYLNTAKAHEIAMLIDNKIMKTIEREHISERKLKHSISGSIGKKDVFSNTIGYSNEESLHNKVYENFDIKTTKSIMLRKIYDTAKENSSGELKEGDLVLFKDVNLKQLNIDDTIMILDFLKESKFKNQETDGVELNYNKMFEMMIDDFTIDYSFKYKKNKMDEKSFIIQLPYNSNENFENGYHQNDLQLGKLSIIGIYRGEVDFSKKIGTSLKLLELVKQSINNNTSRNMETEIMKSSSKRPEEQNNPFEINDNKLEGMNSLIDVIAIIQEININ